jgi:hypothetical protein
MRLGIRDVVAALIVAAILTPYVGTPVRDEPRRWPQAPFSKG